MVPEHDNDILARTVYGEARSELMAGMIGVAWTAKNRAAIAAAHEAKYGTAHQHFGDGSIASACQAHVQYSCWNQGDPNRMEVICVEADTSAVFRECINVADQVIAGTMTDPTHNSTHYFADTMEDPPAWSIGHKPVAHLGHHLFFNDIPA